VALFLALVAPQVGAGFARLHSIWANNFQLPAEWTEFLDKRFAEFQSMPIVGKIVGEGRALLDKLTDYFSNFSADTVTSIINNGFNVLGGTMSVVWTFFLYLVLTVIFVIYASRIRIVAARIFHVRASVLHRFVNAIHSALKGIFMGVIFVAAIQGFLCGIGFAIVGFGQFAFWGLLATLVAPIPVVGTALVWLPLSIQLWFSGQTVEAVTLVLWGAVVVSTADSVLRPLFLKQGIKASFLVLIVVILCGISTFGAVGLILGPVLLAFAIQAIEEGGRAYRSRFTEADLEPAQASPEAGLPAAADAAADAKSDVATDAKSDAATGAGAAAPAEGEAK
jgi:predicted PurR-regulated permease PerM